MTANPKAEASPAPKMDARKARLSVGRDVMFAGFDGNQYPATVLAKPRRGLVRIRYCVRGVGTLTPPVPLNRISLQ